MKGVYIYSETSNTEKSGRISFGYHEFNSKKGLESFKSFKAYFNCTTILDFVIADNLKDICIEAYKINDDNCKSIISVGRLENDCNEIHNLLYRFRQTNKGFYTNYRIRVNSKSIEISGKVSI